MGEVLDQRPSYVAERPRSRSVLHLHPYGLDGMAAKVHWFADIVDSGKKRSTYEGLAATDPPEDPRGSVTCVGVLPLPQQARESACRPRGRN